MPDGLQGKGHETGAGNRIGEPMVILVALGGRIIVLGIEAERKEDMVLLGKRVQ